MLFFSHSVVSDSLWLPGLQHSRLPCPSLSPGVCSNSCPVSWWCHPAISSSVVPFCFCPQSFPASGSFPMSQLFASGGQSIGASASVLSMNIWGWLPLEWTGLISLKSKGLSRVFSSIESNSCFIDEATTVTLTGLEPRAWVPGLSAPLCCLPQWDVEGRGHQGWLTQASPPPLHPAPGCSSRLHPSVGGMGGSVSSHRLMQVPRWGQPRMSPS